MGLQDALARVQIACKPLETLGSWEACGLVVGCSRWEWGALHRLPFADTVGAVVIPWWVGGFLDIKAWERLGWRVSADVPWEVQFKIAMIGLI